MASTELDQAQPPHFHVLGVPVRMRPAAGIVPISMGLLAFALARRKTNDTRAAALVGLVSALFVYPTELTHAPGHILSARQAGAPMDRIDWGVGAFTLYDDNDVPPHQHIGRAVGGPIVSLLSALVWLLAWQTLKGTRLGVLAQVACLQNILAGFGSLAPLRFVDGGVILDNLREL